MDHRGAERRGEDAWHLFVDESGSRRREPRLVAGLLVRGGEPGALREELRGVVGRIWPDVPYPPHATDLRWIASGAAAAALAAGAGNEDQDEHPGTGALALFRAHRDDAAVRPFVDALDEGGWPGRDALRDASLWLEERGRRARPWSRDVLAWNGLAGRRESQQVRLRAELRRFAGSQQAPRAMAAFGAVAPRRDPGEDWVARAGDPDGAAYGAALESMLGLVTGFLRGRAPPRPVRLHLHVANRSADLDGRGRRHLTTTQIERIAEAAARFPLLEPRSGKGDALLHFDVAPPPTYNQCVHPGIVLADALANALFHRLGGRLRNDSWERLRRDMGSTMPFHLVAAPLWDPAPPAGRATAVLLPLAVPAWDPPRQRLLGAFAAAGGDVEPVPGEDPAWASDVTRAWTRAARATGGTLRWQ